MFSSLVDDNKMQTSFMNGFWADKYELRLEDKPITDANWSEAVLQDGDDITIHIVEKAPQSLPHRLRPSFTYNGTNFTHRGRAHHAASTMPRESS